MVFSDQKKELLLVANSNERFAIIHQLCLMMACFVRKKPLRIISNLVLARCLYVEKEEFSLFLHFTAQLLLPSFRNNTERTYRVRLNYKSGGTKVFYDISCTLNCHFLRFHTPHPVVSLLVVADAESPMQLKVKASFFLSLRGCGSKNHGHLARQ